MKQNKTVSDNVPARILILTVIVAVIVCMTAYLRFFIADVYITAGLLAVLCLYFAAVILAAKGESAYKLCVTVFLTIIFVLAFVIGANVSGVAVHFQTHETMVAWIKSLHGRAEFIYIVFHIVQVLVLPIPGIISIIAGTVLFGPFKAATLSLIGAMIGCVMMFWAGRLFGKKLAGWIAGKEAVDKYLNMVKGKDKLMLTSMFILPFFPDDLLCIIAGLTTMSFRYFFVMVFFTRVFTIYTTAYFGSGQIIPYHGWGLAAWAVLVVFTSILLVMLWRKGDKIQGFIEKKFAKKK